MLSRHLYLLLVILPGFTISPLFAHGDGEQPRYVAANGQDQGRCDNLFRPCKTIAYAAAHAGKGDRILLEKGRYELQSAEDVFYLSGGLNEVLGGYSRIDHFQKQDAARYPTYLIGAPREYRDRLQANGFHVISDTKTLSSADKQQVERMLAQFKHLQQSKAFTRCDGNHAGAYACDHVDLLAHIALTSMSSRPAEAIDVWGFTDLNSGREYALLGLQNGVAVFDVSTPETPVEIATLAGQNSGWRDIKIYQYYDQDTARWRAYAYISTDSASNRLAIIDLSPLPNAIRAVGNKTADNSAHNVYISRVDYTFGLSKSIGNAVLQVAGSNLNRGAFRAYRLSDPENPQPLTDSNRGYTHDASSMSIDDARKDTQCVNAGTLCEVLFDFNETTFDIWDISLPGNPVALSSTTYSGAGYVHSGWWSEDKRHLFVHDEFDELNNSSNTRVRVFSLDDLRQPQLLTTWQGATRAIDHNGYSRGNRYYISNYTRGLTVLDISNPRQPLQRAYFDTFPVSDNASFNGAWGVYPYLPSGTILVSDINSGLYLLKEQTLNNPYGDLQFGASHYSAVEGETLNINISRSGGDLNAVSVAIESINANTDDDDYQLNTTVLHWNAGEAEDKVLTLDLSSDATEEPLETLLLRLHNPANGAGLGAINIARITIADTGRAPRIGFDQTEIHVNKALGRAFVLLKRLDSTVGTVSVHYRTLPGTAQPGVDFTAVDNGSITWAEGDASAKLIEIEVNPSSSNDKILQLELFNPSGASLHEPSTATLKLGSRMISATPSATPTPTHPPAASSGGGGSSFDIGFILLSGLLIAMRRYPREFPSKPIPAKMRAG